MAKTVGAQPDSARVVSVGDVVCLIAPRAPREVIAAGLRDEGYEVVSFDCVSAFVGEDVELPCAIVACIDDALAGATREIESLVESASPSPVVMVCESVQRREIRAALAAGAAGVVVYDELADSLAPCLRAVCAGQLCVPRGHWRQVEPPVLSNREKQILSLVVMGYMNSQIAEQLFLAESTVKSHLSSAFGKLGVRSRNEAVDLIINPQRGLGMGILGLSSEPLEPIAMAK
jgi:DNA-binding NarL/FixJ family response regulator